MTGIVFKLDDKVDVNYEGPEDTHGWRMGIVRAVDKGVLIFYIIHHIC